MSQRDESAKEDRELTRHTGVSVRKLPRVEDLVGANAPCDPIPPPPEDRQWDTTSGRWVRPGPSIPPDPGGITYPPATRTPEGLAPLDLVAQGEEPIEDPADVPMPRWGIAVVGVMFGVGIALGLLFAML